MPIAMPFADATPLEDLLKYVSQATATAESAGIFIVVDAFGLQQAGKSLQSTGSIEIEGAPLMTTLRLFLKQLGLAYTIEDGLVVVSSSEVIQSLKPRWAANDHEAQSRSGSVFTRRSDLEESPPGSPQFGEQVQE